jgi:hypothetical protein
MAGYLKPTSDISSSVFTNVGSGTGKWGRINTPDVPDDTNGIEWDSTVAGSPACVVRLDTSDPGVDDSQSVKIRVRSAGFEKDISGTIEQTLDATLFEGDPGSGGAVRAALTFSRGQGDAYAWDEYELTGGEKSSITDWGNLYLQIANPSVTGTGDAYLRVSEAGVFHATASGGGGGGRSAWILWE